MTAFERFRKDGILGSKRKEAAEGGRGGGEEGEDYKVIEGQKVKVVSYWIFTSYQAEGRKTAKLITAADRNEFYL